MDKSNIKLIRKLVEVFMPEWKVEYDVKKKKFFEGEILPKNGFIQVIDEKNFITYFFLKNYPIDGRDYYALYKWSNFHSSSGAYIRLADLRVEDSIVDLFFEKIARDRFNKIKGIK